MWSVRVLTGVNAGQIFDLQMGKNVIGRGGHSHFKISSLGISKEHCEIHVYKDKVILIDLKSSNGTFLNGVKIQNAIIKLGDKISVFDVILDVIPNQNEVMAERKAKLAQSSAVAKSVASPKRPAVLPQMYNNINQGNNALQMQPQMQPGYQPQMSYTQIPQRDLNSNQYNNLTQNIEVETQSLDKLQVENLSALEKLDAQIEAKLMPLVYRLAEILPFKQVLLSFVIIFVFALSFLSLVPLTTIMEETNLIEAGKRAKSIARTLAKANEAALMAGQFQNISVEDVKEDGIKEALIIQQSDGAIIAPVEKAGREYSKAFVGRARRENRAIYEELDNRTVAASHPIGVYDPTTGETQVKYLAIVYYNVASLSVSQDRIISLLVQVLVLGSILGGILFFLFSRVISYPIVQLNKQIDQAFRDKTDRTEIKYDDQNIQKLVTNVNLMLNRMWNGFSEGESQKPQQNKSLEYGLMVESIAQPALVIDKENTIIACNQNFATLLQADVNSLLNSSYKNLSDSSLSANIDNLITRAQSSVYERQIDRIPFSQFECEISLSAWLGESGQVDYYFVTLTKISESE